MGEALHRIEAGGLRYVVTRARRDDVPALVALLTDDVLGASREASGDGDLTAYVAAFARIDADPAHLLLAVRGGAGGDEVVATAQLTTIPGLARAGATRLLVEAVRVAPEHRGGGLGRALFTWIAEHARSRGAGLVQLTSDKRRADAHRFYESLGYVASHQGFKLDLAPGGPPRGAGSTGTRVRPSTQHTGAAGDRRTGSSDRA